MKRILITGFMPFNNASLNPAWEAVKGVTAPEGVELVKKEISVVFGQAIDELLQAVEELHPDAVICVGLAQGRNGITPERVAINVNDARIPDNAGACPVDEAIRADGPAAYFTKLPIKAIVEAINAAGIKSQVSNTAGTYVCSGGNAGVRTGGHYKGIDHRCRGDGEGLPVKGTVILRRSGELGRRIALARERTGKDGDPDTDRTCAESAGSGLYPLFRF